MPLAPIKPLRVGHPQRQVLPRLPSFAGDDGARSLDRAPFPNWQDTPMSKEAEYRGLAAACLNLARTVRTLAEKARLLAIAEAWLELAERAKRSPKVSLYH